jgi:hypothetical protein
MTLMILQVLKIAMITLTISKECSHNEPNKLLNEDVVVEEAAVAELL